MLGDLPLLAASFRRHLLAVNKAARTVAGYLDAVRLLNEFLAAQRMPGAVAAAPTGEQDHYDAIRPREAERGVTRRRAVASAYPMHCRLGWRCGDPPPWVGDLGVNEEVAVEFLAL